MIKGKRNKKKEYLDELEILEDWYDKEASARVRFYYNKLDRKSIDELELNKLHLGGLNSKELLKVLNNDKYKKVETVYMQGAYLRHEDLFSLSKDVSYNFSEANLGYSSINHSTIRFSYFNRAILFDINFAGVEFKIVEFENAHMGEASFCDECVLNKCKFDGADLWKSDFQDIEINKTSFKRVKFDSGKFLEGTSFKGCDLRHATFYKAEFHDSVTLDGCKVEIKEWFYKLEDMGAKGIDTLKEKYEIQKSDYPDINGNEYYIINESTYYKHAEFKGT